LTRHHLIIRFFMLSQIFMLPCSREWDIFYINNFLNVPKQSLHVGMTIHPARIELETFSVLG
jgi:hypothetical protein